MRAVSLTSHMRRFRLASVLCGLLVGAVFVTVGSTSAMAQDDADSSSIVAMDADGDNLRSLYNREGHWSGTPSFSPDGKLLLFDSCLRRFLGETHIYVTSATDAAAEPSDLGPGYAPAWSPDGKQIAFYLQPDNTQRQTPGVWTMNADGSDRKWLCAGKAPRWSPDGSQIALVYVGETGNTIHLYDLKSEETKTVLDRTFPRIAGAAWSPDGKRLAIIAQTGSGTDLLLVPTAGEDRTQHIRFRGDIGWRPNWSPDGAYLAFWLRDAAGRRKLHRLEVDTDRAPELLDHQDDSDFNSDATWSPDGKQILWIQAK